MIVHRWRERSDLRRQLERLIQENHDNISLAAELVTLLPASSAQLKDLLNEAYIRWIAEARHRAAPPAACTRGRLREVVLATVHARFQADYDTARLAEEFEQPRVDPDRLSDMARGEVLSIGKGLPPYDRMELAIAYRRSREELTEDVRWIFRWP